MDRTAKQARVGFAAIRAIPRKTAWAWLVGTFFGAGLLGPGPGTFGSAAAALLWFLAARVSGAEHLAWDTAIAALCVTAVGIPAATIVAREAGREDPGFVVVDELAGQLVALIGMPADWAHCLLALLLFRLFDITKPQPVKQLERLPGGWGIMLDDVAAGVMALAVGHLILLWR